MKKLFIVIGLALLIGLNRQIAAYRIVVGNRTDLPIQVKYNLVVCSDPQAQEIKSEEFALYDTHNRRDSWHAGCALRQIEVTYNNKTMVMKPLDHFAHTTFIVELGKHHDEIIITPFARDDKKRIDSYLDRSMHNLAQVKRLQAIRDADLKKERKRHAQQTATPEEEKKQKDRIRDIEHAYTRALTDARAAFSLPS